MDLQKWVILFSACILVTFSLNGCAVQDRVGMSTSEYGVFSGTREISFHTESDAPAEELPYEVSMTAGDVQIVLFDEDGTDVGHHGLSFGFNQKGIGEFGLSGEPDDRYVLRIEGTAVNFKLHLGYEGVVYDSDTDMPEPPTAPEPPEAPEPPAVPELPEAPEPPAAPEPPTAPEPPEAPEPPTAPTPPEKPEPHTPELDREFSYTAVSGREEIHIVADEKKTPSTLPYRYSVTGGSVTFSLYDSSGELIDSQDKGYGFIMEGNGSFSLTGEAGASYTLEIVANAASLKVELPSEGLQYQ